MLECPWQATGERAFFSAGRVLSVLLADFQKGLKNSSWEEEGINELCSLIGQSVSESLGRGIDSREKLICDSYKLKRKLNLEYHATKISLQFCPFSL